MALIDKASLLMVPSVVAEGKAFNVLPSGNRAPDSTNQNSGYDQTRADFDFDRGSNAAATRIGSDGLLKKYRENLFTESNNFSDSDWTKAAGGSFTSGQPDKDGGTDAWKFNSTTAANSGAWQNVTLSGVATFSAYFKKGTLNKIAFVNFAGNSYECYFDLENGVIEQQTGDLINAKIEAVGTDGWYRCSITDIASGTNYLQLKPTDNLSSTATQSGYIYIQSAQLETSLVATDYLDSTSVTGKAGVLVDLPRINYDANGENGALLLEPSRSNLVQYSEYINNTDWNHQGVVSSVNTSETKSPEGFYNAVKLEATNTDPYIFKSISVSTGDNTFSFYIKGTGSSVGKTGRILFWYIGTATGAQTSHDFTLTNEWQRVDATTSVTGAGTLTFRIDIPANASVSGEICYLYGLQLEAGSYPTSYIPNHSGTGGVTRAADSCTGAADSDSINSTEGVLYVETSALSSGSFRAISLSNNTNSNVVGLLYRLAANEIWMQVRSNGAETNIVVYSVNQLQNNKIAIKYKENDFALWVNGVEEGTNNSGSTPVSLNTIKFARGDGGETFYGNVKQVAVFNEALSDSELATLTTL